MARAAAAILLVAALACLAALSTTCVDARRLNAETGTVEVKEFKVYDDINGGVAPLEERIEAASELLSPRLALIAVEAECRKNKDVECRELKVLKKKLKDEEDEDKDGEVVLEVEIEEIQAPCRQSVFWSYFLGTVCLPPKPYDTKPAKKKD